MIASERVQSGGLRAALSGAAYPLRAAWLLVRAPALWVYMAVPVLINMVILGLLSYLLVPPALRWIDEIIRGLPPWALPLAFIPRMLLLVALLLVLGFLVLQFGAIIGSPWYERLSQRLESRLRPERANWPEEPFNLRFVLRDIGRALAFTCYKAIVAIAVGIPIFLVGIVPLVGPFVAGVGQFTLGAFLVGLDVLDPPLERRRLSFGEKVALFFAQSPASFGMGAICLVLLGVPLLNLFFIPICVAAGTIFYCDRVSISEEAK